MVAGTVNSACTCSSHVCTVVRNRTFGYTVYCIACDLERPLRLSFFRRSNSVIICFKSRLVGFVLGAIENRRGEKKNCRAEILLYHFITDVLHMHSEKPLFTKQNKNKQR